MGNGKGRPGTRRKGREADGEGHRGPREEELWGKEESEV